MTKEKNFTIFQMPNPPLILAGFGYLIELITHGDLKIFGTSLMIISLTIWAYLEIVSGVNWFRRLLGTFVIINTFIKLFSLLS